MPCKVRNKLARCKATVFKKARTKELPFKKHQRKRKTNGPVFHCAATAWLLFLLPPYWFRHHRISALSFAPIISSSSRCCQARAANCSLESALSADGPLGLPRSAQSQLLLLYPLFLYTQPSSGNTRRTQRACPTTAPAARQTTDEPIPGRPGTRKTQRVRCRHRLEIQARESLV